MSAEQAQLWSEASSDAELISAVRVGDSAAYGALYERHAVAARTVAMQYVRTRADADDVVADAFVRTLSVLQNGGGPDVTFRAYLFTVVRRLSYDLVNGARRTRPTDDDGTFESAFGPMASTEDPTLEGFERSIVTRAYQALPERWRAVLWYTEVENLPPAEIAPILGISANGVAALSYRAREGLRQAYLQQHLGGVPAQECEAVNALLGSYVRGGLAKRETARVEEHLDGCGECRALVLELGDVSHGMRAVIAPLVLGVGALGLVGRALPVHGGAAVGAGTAVTAGGATAGGATAGGATTGGGTAVSATAGGATAGGAGAGGASAGGATVGAATGGASAGGVASAGAAAGGATAGAAGTGVGATAGVAAAGATAAGAGAASGTAVAAGGIAALVASAPLASAAVAVGVLAVTGLGIAGAMGAFSPAEPAAPPAAVSTAVPAEPDTTAAPTAPATAPDEPDADPTSPTDVPAPDPAIDDAVTTPAEPVVDSEIPVLVTPPSDPATTSPGTVDPVGPAPTPDPVTPPAPAALDLTLGRVDLVARQSTQLPMTVSNSGGQAADDVSVDVILPAGVSVPSSGGGGGMSVVQVLSAESMRCGTGTSNGDGTTTVTCGVGTIAAGSSAPVSVAVEADAGGEYYFAGAVSAKGVERVSKKFTYPRSASYYGAEVRVAPRYAADATAFPVTNPGLATMKLEVRNSGDRTAADLGIAVALPDGVRLAPGGGSATTGWDCSQRSDGPVRCAPASGTTLAAKEKATVAVRVLAAEDGAPATTDTVRVVPSATDTVDGDDASGGSTVARLDVGESWDGAEESLGGPVEAVCEAPDEARIVLEDFSNETAYDALDVTLKAAGSSVNHVLAVGDSATLRVDDGVRFPAGSAQVVLSTVLAGERFEHRLDAGDFPATDCWTQPSWADADDVTVEATNVDGAVRYTAHVTNDTGVKMDVRLLAPGAGAWAAVADSAAVAPLRPGESADLVLETGRASMPAATATLRQYRWNADEDGDGKGYQSLLPVPLTAQTVAPSAPAPSVGSCTFDRSSETSSAPVSLLLDNSASTLPVTFEVPGQLEPVAVGAKTTRTVDTTVGGKDVTLEVRADGKTIATHVVPAVDCFSWAPIKKAASANAGWVAGKGGSTGSTVLTGTFRNPYGATTLRVTMSADGHGSSRVVEVSPGKTATLTLGISARDVAAGRATFTAERVGATTGTTSASTSAGYASSSYAPRWARTATVEAQWDGESVKLVGTLTNDTDETLDARMLGGAYGDSAPVQKIAPGKSASFTIDTRSLDVPAGSVSFRQYRYVIDKGFADTALRAGHGGARYTPDWSVTPTATATCTGAGAATATVSASLRNDSAEAMGVVVQDALGTTDLGAVAPGTTGSATFTSGGLTADAGTVTFTLTREHLGTTFTRTVTADHAAINCTVAEPAARTVLGTPTYDQARDHSYRNVSVVLDNSGSNVPVTFGISGDAKGSWDVAAGDRRTVSLGQAPWTGARYTVRAGSWSTPLVVEPFSAAPACYGTWHAWRWYSHSADVSENGWNYAARNGSFGVRPGSDKLQVFWERESRCGQG